MKPPTPSVCINIFGSCVTRDVVEFAAGLTVGKYCARQSVVSAVANRPMQETIDALQFVEGTHPFHQRCVQEDFDKTTLNELGKRSSDEVAIVDFIEERTPLGVTPCNTIISLSQAATKFSNARPLITRTISPYSEEHIDLFGNAIRDFSMRLNGRPVIVHRSLYSPGDWEFERANRVLDQFYTQAIPLLQPIAVVESAPELRISGTNHKWGLAPYHYIDEYYKDIVRQISEQTGMALALKSRFSLQKST